MKKKENGMRLQFDGVSRNEAFARTVVASFAAQLDPTLDEIADIRTAVSEAVTNCIVHGYPDRIGKITITAQVTEDRVLTVTVRDRGVGIGDIALAMTPEYTTSRGSERSGLGFSVMEAFMDSLKVRSEPGKGTIVTMKKKLRGKLKAQSVHE